MKTSSQRNENSVQMSLKQLRDLHTRRVENDIAAARRKRDEATARAALLEQQRLDEIRAAEEMRQAAEYERERERLAAEHELELAKERTRAEAEARVLERQLELQLKQTDAEILKVQAAQPKRRIWAVLAVAAMLLLGGYTWHQQKQADEKIASVNSTLLKVQSDNEQAENAIALMRQQLKDAEASGAQDKDRISHLKDEIAKLEEKIQNRRSKRPRTRPRPRPRPRPEPRGPVVPTCVDNPLC